jgi:hypothetical protein
MPQNVGSPPPIAPGCHRGFQEPNEGTGGFASHRTSGGDRNSGNLPRNLFVNSHHVGNPNIQSPIASTTLGYSKCAYSHRIVGCSVSEPFKRLSGIDTFKDLFQ